MIKVQRHSFFRPTDETQRQTRRFTENAPAEPCGDEHNVCNCTKTVNVRPDGEPDQVQQEISYIDGDDGVSFGLCSLWLTIGKMGKSPHTYFIFKPGERSVNIEKVVEEKVFDQVYGKADCFFAHLHQGNKIDTSAFMNGWRESRVVDKTKIEPTDVWAHSCHWGGESIQFLPLGGGEEKMWHLVFSLVSALEAKMAPFRDDFNAPVETLRDRVENCPGLLTLVYEIVALLREVDVHLVDLDTFQISEAARIAAVERGRAMAEERERQDREYAESIQEPLN